MTDRTYGQFCSLAAALDVLGDRWTLLVVRELLLGAARFSEIADGLPGCSPSLLTERLRTLEGAGFVERDGSLYRLTPSGKSLREPVVALGRVGIGLLVTTGPPAGAEPLLHVMPLGIVTMLCLEALPEGPLRIHLDLVEGAWTVDIAPSGARSAVDRVNVAENLDGAADAVVTGSLFDLALAGRGGPSVVATGAEAAVYAVHAIFAPA